MITLEQIKDLGFNFEKGSDNVYKEELGIDWWLVTKKLSKRITLYYRVEEGRVELLRCNKQGRILGRMQIDTIEKLLEIIKFWEGEK